MPVDMVSITYERIKRVSKCWVQLQAEPTDFSLFLRILTGSGVKLVSKWQRGCLLSSRSARAWSRSLNSSCRSL